MKLSKKPPYLAPTVVFTLFCFVTTLLPAQAIGDAVESVSVGGLSASPTQGGSGLPTASGAAVSGGRVNLATGAATASYPFTLPMARGGAQPGLALTYDSSRGVGYAGEGWTLDTPSITRRGHAGVPRFQDNVVPSNSDLNTDDYYIEGKLLIQVGAIDTAPPAGFPTTSPANTGLTWVMFRAEIDDGNRYFFDSQTWVMQTKAGHLVQFGLPLDASGNPPAGQSIQEAFGAGLEYGPGAQVLPGNANDGSNPVYRWRLVRDTDSIGNTVYYRWSDQSALYGTGVNGTPIQAAAVLFLTDIYDTSSQAPTNNLTTAPPAWSTFAHHTHLTWMLPAFPSFPVDLLSHGVNTSSTAASNTVPTPYANSPVWKVDPYAQLSTVDVTSATSSSASRYLVREYKLAYQYNATQTRSFLTSVQEAAGNCSASPIGEPTTDPTSINTFSTAVTACANTEKSASDTVATTTYVYSGVGNATTFPPNITLTNSAAYTSTGGTPDFLADLNGDAVDDLVSGTVGVSASNLQSCVRGSIQESNNQGSFSPGALGLVSAMLPYPGNCLLPDLNPSHTLISSPTMTGGGTFHAASSNGLWSITANDSLWTGASLADWGSTGQNSILEAFPGTGNESLADLDYSILQAGSTGVGLLELGALSSSTPIQSLLSTLPTSAATQLSNNLGYNNAMPGRFGLSGTACSPYVGGGVTPSEGTLCGAAGNFNDSTLFIVRPPAMFAGTQAFDIDGDGFPDMPGVLTSTINGVWPFQPSYENFFTTRDRAGRTYPFFVDSAFNVGSGQGLCTPEATIHFSGTNMPMTLADMDGDGILDQVFFTKVDGYFGSDISGCQPSANDSLSLGCNDGAAGLQAASSPGNYLGMAVLIGRGDGRFGVAPSTSATNNACSESAGTAIVPGYDPHTSTLATTKTGFEQTSPALSADTVAQDIVRFGDLNGDGFADVAILDSTGLHICLRVSGLWENAQWSCKTASGSFPWVNEDSATLKTVVPTLMIGDLDASGINQVVYFPAPSTPFGSPGQATAVAASPHSGTSGVRDGMLISVSNGLGATTTFTYDTVHHLNATGNLPMSTNLPVPAWVVTQVSTTNGLSGSEAVTLTSSYSYVNPTYDPRDREFVGFKTVKTKTNSVTNSPGTLTTTNFATTTCLDTTSCTGGAIDYSFYRFSRGKVASVEVADASGAPIYSTTAYQYTLQNPYTDTTSGGRKGLSVASVQTDGYAWGQSQTSQNFAFNAFSGASTPTLPEVSIPTSGADIRSIENFDGNGNLASSIDEGIVNQDLTQATVTTWDLPGGTTGSYQGSSSSGSWAFRPVKVQTGYSNISGVFNGVVREIDADYDSLGFQLDTFTPSVTGDLSLPGPSQAPWSGVRSAPQPASFSGEVFLSRHTHDVYGNPQSIGQMINPCQVSIAYDSTFNELPVTSTVHPQYNLNCDATDTTGLTTHYTFDFGLQKQTVVTSPANEMTIWKYDDFGRTIEVDQPSAVASMATTMAYQVIGGFPIGNPISVVHVQTADGPENSSGVAGYFVDHYRYVDGFGEQRAAIDPMGEVSTSGPTQWVVSGQHSSYANGRVESVYAPTLAAQTPSAIGDALPPLPTKCAQKGCAAPAIATSVYDALGRVTSITDFNGNPSAYVYDTSTTALLVDIHDQEQDTSGGVHAAGHTQILKNGHGQTSQTVQYIGGGNSDARGATNTATAVNYLATGEPYAVTQTPMGGTSVQRTMTYDSIGRMVQNHEPNSGTWTYAYDLDSRLVGTSDARGCGENLTYDGIGRIVAEDYSPCASDASQPTYTAPTGLPTSGDGTEAFYTYGTNGRLAAVQDRAKSDAYSYDARGRLTLLSRQIAIPTGSAAIASRYAVNRYVENFTYDAAQRPLGDAVHNPGAIATSQTEGVVLPIGGQGLGQNMTYTYDGRLYSLAITSGNTANNFGTVISSQQYNPTGTLELTQFGDAAQTKATYGYFADNSLQSYSFNRAAGPWATATFPAWTSAQGTTPVQGDLADVAIVRDKVGNPTSYTDTSTGSWPAGSLTEKTQNFKYYDDYRLASVAYNANGTADSWVSPYLPEQNKGGTLYALPTTEAKRIQNQAFGYDIRGNITAWTDDPTVHDYPDRGLGTSISYGTNQTSQAAGPDQFAHVAIGANNMYGWYDPAGNMVTYGTIAGTLASPTWLENFQYSYDELGRLAIANRYEGSPDMTQDTFTSDSGGKPIIMEQTNSGVSNYTIQVFDSLMLRNVPYDSTHKLYVATGTDANGSSPEHVYFGGGLVHILQNSSMPLNNYSAGSGNSQHLFMNLPNPIGTTAFVIDYGSGEVVEKTTHQVYGGLDSDDRQTRWTSYRSDKKFTGQQDLAEVGLVSMGARFYAPQLGRFITPDPLYVQEGFGDPNPYEYADGNPIAENDPSGLDADSDPVPPGGSENGAPEELGGTIRSSKADNPGRAGTASAQNQAMANGGHENPGPGTDSGPIQSSGPSTATHLDQPSQGSARISQPWAPRMGGVAATSRVGTTVAQKKSEAADAFTQTVAVLGPQVLLGAFGASIVVQLAVGAASMKRDTNLTLAAAIPLGKVFGHNSDMIKDHFAMVAQGESVGGNTRGMRLPDGRTLPALTVNAVVDQRSGAILDIGNYAHQNELIAEALNSGEAKQFMIQVGIDYGGGNTADFYVQLGKGLSPTAQAELDSVLAWMNEVYVAK